MPASHDAGIHKSYGHKSKITIKTNNPITYEER